MRGVCPACIVGVKVTSHIGREKTGGDLFLTICDYEWKPLGFLRGLIGGVFIRFSDGFGLSACGAMLVREDWTKPRMAAQQPFHPTQIQRESLEPAFPPVLSFGARLPIAPRAPGTLSLLQDKDAGVSGPLRPLSLRTQGVRSEVPTRPISVSARI